MNEKIFTEILTKNGFRVEKELTVWTDVGNWYIAYIPNSRFNFAIAVYVPGEDTATICSEFGTTTPPVKIECKSTKEVDIDGLEKACVELNVKVKEIFKQIKLKEINSDF